MEYVPAKTLLTRSKDTGWFGMEYNMNIYRGCTHGCIYCDSRSACYRIDRFDTVRAKEDALRILRDDLRRKVRTGVVGTGSMSDPYNPFEEELCLTRHALELLDAYGFGVGIATKSALVARDLDLLRDIAAHSPVLVKITVTTTDEALAAQIEPRAPSPARRLAAVEALARAGIFCGLLLMPVLPFLEDNAENIVSVVRAAKEHGARFVYPGFGVTLRENQRDYFFSRLDERFPGLKEQYIRRYGGAYSCRARDIKGLWRTFTQECGRLGLLYEMRDITAAYKQGYGASQLSFFGG